MPDRTPARSAAVPSRREFLKTSSLLAAGGALAGSLGLARSAHAAGSDTLKVGLIGCGGRGTGAAAQAARAPTATSSSSAMADAFADRLETSLDTCKATTSPPRVDVADDHRFVGFDAYKQVIGQRRRRGAAVLRRPTSGRSTSRPPSRPASTSSAEKPVAVDAPGVRSGAGDVPKAKAEEPGRGLRPVLPLRPAEARN